MKVNRIYKCMSIRYKNNNNFEIFNKSKEFYAVIQSIYKFYDKETQILFMMNYGITCGCERRIQNKKISLYYNGIPITENQKRFLNYRARMLITGLQSKGFNCGCKKKKST